jgi:hypothetical protein
LIRNVYIHTKKEGETMSRHTHTRAAMGELIAGVRAPGAALGFARFKAIQGAGFIGSHLFFFADFGVAVDSGLAFSLLNVAPMNTLFGGAVAGAPSLIRPHWLLARGA